jgi:predicted DNA-binding transcriptional regulator AlpA
MWSTNMDVSSRLLDRTAGAEYITLQDAARLTGMGVGLLLNLGASDPTFPRLIRVSTRKRLYRVAELRAWIESRRGADPLAKARRAKAKR